jgi:hypothetical protein
MKIKTTLTALALAAAIATATAHAAGPVTVKGKWAGVAFASVIDLDHDGNAARTFDVPAYDQLVFTAVQGIVDASLVALPGQGSCADPAAFELLPVGSLIFRGRGANALYATVDSSRHLCFNPANPNEELYFKISGGRGSFAGKSGTGTARLHDVTIEANASGFSLVVDTVGDFTLTYR